MQSFDYGLLLMIVISVGVLFNKSIYIPAKKWLIGGFVGVDLVGLISQIVHINLLMFIGLIILFGIAPILIGIELVRKNR